jgi:hypothetical protein
MDNKQKAKRKLKGFDFAKDGAAVALVGPSVGGPANGIPTLIAKANNFSPEFIKKMQQVQVTMELPAFLEKFFGIWGSDAEVLARLMGYEKPEDEDEDEGDWWENYIEEKLSAFTIIKSLHEAKNLPEALSKLTEQDYLDVLNDQVLIEKALKEFDEKSDTSAKTVEPKVEASASKVIKNKKEKQMTDMVEKEKLVAVEKALEDQKVALEKALAQVKEYEEAQKQAIVKSKTDAVNAVVKDEKQAAVVLKAALALDSKEDFDALVEVFKSMNTLIEKGALFQEQGGDASPEDEVGKKTALQKALENKYKANQQ